MFVVWEPVLPTDWSAPSSSALKRIADPRAVQYWDRRRLLSHLMGEHDRRSIVWDYVAVYSPGEQWGKAPPTAVYEGGPVVHVTAELEHVLKPMLNAESTQNRLYEQLSNDITAIAWSWRLKPWQMNAGLTAPAMQ